MRITSAVHTLLVTHKCWKEVIRHSYVHFLHSSFTNIQLVTLHWRPHPAHTHLIIQIRMTSFASKQTSLIILLQ